MRAHGFVIALLLCFSGSLGGYLHAQQRSDVPITVRPATLADTIEELAGHTVNVPYARVVGVINPRVIIVDTAVHLRPVFGNRDRLVVLVQPGALRVPRAAIVGQTVKVIGVARTVLGAQVAREVSWPSELRPEVIRRLEVRAAILASSIQTAEGIELTSASAPATENEKTKGGRPLGASPTHLTASGDTVQRGQNASEDK